MKLNDAQSIHVQPFWPSLKAINWIVNKIRQGVQDFIRQFYQVAGPPELANWAGADVTHRKQYGIYALIT